MQKRKNIIECYDKTAKNYAQKYIGELSYKHFDRLLLKSFAFEIKKNSKVIDLGCGPGQTTKYLYDCGLQNILGTDISPQMIKVASSINPIIDFEVADILKLQYADSSFDSAIAFYSIVHFEYDQLGTAFKEVKRVLADKGLFLFSFHIGDSILHLDDFLDNEVNIDFHFFEVTKVLEKLIQIGFEIIDVIERFPYREIEYQSRRAYIWTKNKKIK